MLREPPVNPFGHLLGCQVQPEISIRCPACKWNKLQWSVPSKPESFEERLTDADRKALKEWKIGE